MFHAAERNEGTVRFNAGFLLELSLCGGELILSRTDFPFRNKPGSLVLLSPKRTSEMDEEHLELIVPNSVHHQACTFLGHSNSIPQEIGYNPFAPSFVADPYPRHVSVFKKEMRVNVCCARTSPTNGAAERPNVKDAEQHHPARFDPVHQPADQRAARARHQRAGGPGCRNSGAGPAEVLEQRRKEYRPGVHDASPNQEQRDEHTRRYNPGLALPRVHTCYASHEPVATRSTRRAAPWRPHSRFFSC